MIGLLWSSIILSVPGTKSTNQKHCLVLNRVPGLWQYHYAYCNLYNVLNVFITISLFTPFLFHLFFIFQIQSAFVASQRQIIMNGIILRIIYRVPLHLLQVCQPHQNLSFLLRVFRDISENIKFSYNILLFPVAFCSGVENFFSALSAMTTRFSSIYALTSGLLNHRSANLCKLSFEPW